MLTLPYPRAANADLFCEQPYGVICQMQCPVKGDIIEHEISEAAAFQTLQFFSLPEITPPSFSEILGNLFAGLQNYLGQTELHSKSETLQNWTVYYLACTDFLAREKVSGLPSQAPCFGSTRSNSSLGDLNALQMRLSREYAFPKIKNMIKSARSEVLTVLDNSEISSELKLTLREKLSKTVTPTFNRFLFEKVLIKGAPFATQRFNNLNEMIEPCEFSLSHPNAVNYSSFWNAKSLEEGSRPGLLICPSVWVKAASSASLSETGAEAASFALLAHEFAHSLDQSLKALARLPRAQDQFVAQKLYDLNLSCLSARFVKSKMLEVDYAWVGRETNLDFDIHTQVPDLYFSEIAADQIAAQALRRYLVKIPSIKEKRDLVARNLVPFCDSVKKIKLTSNQLLKNDLHPAGEFRISENYLRTTSLRERLGCSLNLEEDNCPVF